MVDAAVTPVPIDAAKLAALAEFAAGAGHEINNPLATILGRAQLLLADETDPAKRQALASIAAQALRVRDMIGDVMLFARPPAPKLEAVSVRAAFEEQRRRFDREFIQQARELIVEPVADDLVVTADPVQLAVVLSELLRNSRHALRRDGGSIRISARRSAHDCVSMLVSDNGRGLTDEEREHLFDPFYSGRSAGRGLGFGLCKVWRIVEQHGGSISVRSGENEGAVFRIDWPAPIA